MDNKNLIKIGISQGDPNGVGPEVILKTFATDFWYNYCIPILYGSPKTFVFTKKQLGLQEPNYHLIRSADEARPGKLNLIVANDQAIEISFGTPSEATGSEALACIDRMLQDAKAGLIDAMVTAPVDKSSIKPPGGNFTGHTGYIAKALDSADRLMLLVCDELKIALATEHLSLKEVSAQLNRAGLERNIRSLESALTRDFGIRKPRIAVLGLNPHNGENGLLGTEEKETISPVINQLQQDGHTVFGPYPADGFFGSRQFRKFDAVLAMYHDQGLIPFKYFAFYDGVNYTAGLSIPRTSPDHGTGYDIAGKNIASAESFANAVHLAINIVRKRKNWEEISSNPLPLSQFKRERFRLES